MGESSPSVTASEKSIEIPKQHNHGPDEARAIAEVQGAIIVAQRCPRNESKAFAEVLTACKRPRLAEQAVYSFPRGGKKVTGPSIRLAEVIARNWGNLQYGIREIEAGIDFTKYEAFCWDVQNNVRASRVFSKKHGRWTKKDGFKPTEDPRDSYEVVASDAVRRLRACILEIIPSDIVDEAVAQCRKTIQGKSTVPLKDRVRKMLALFIDMGVEEEVIAKKLKHKVSVITEDELLDMTEIYKSIKDGNTKAADWFVLRETTEEESINAKFTTNETDGSGSNNQTEKSSIGPANVE